MAEELSPPRKSVELEDPGAHTLSSDDSSDHFTDASEGRRRAPSQTSESSRLSPIPLTRVERIDDEPAYGEVPGTEAYQKRTQDAVPDEVVTRSRSASRATPLDTSVISPQIPIPKIIAEKVDPDQPAYGDVPGTEAYEKRKADAVPDVIIKSPISDRPPENPLSSSATSGSAGSVNLSLIQSTQEGLSSSALVDGEPADDFDDFEHGHDEDNEDDFGEFDNGFTLDPSHSPDMQSDLPASTSSLPPIPSINWAEIEDIDDLEEAMALYTTQLFPEAEKASQMESPTPPPQKFLYDRSLSLYQQLVAPPPLAPPNWLRSRIRRLFFVSLGVPVDLDEILPASKQKKLILPSINIIERSPRQSTDSRSAPAGGVSRLKGKNESNLSVDSTGNDRPSNRRKLKDEEQPVFDHSEALRMGSTTLVKLQGLDNEELHKHVEDLIALNERGREAFGYWERRREGAVKEKEAFEGVIENLVKHARKLRK